MERPDPDQKYRQELEAAQKVFSLLGEPQQSALMALWQEYETGASPEARLVKALDKAETIIQHNQGKNPPDFDYAFTLGYGRKYFQEQSILAELRVLIDSEDVYKRQILAITGSIVITALTVYVMKFVEPDTSINIKNPELGYTTTLVAVSYTHLDVYKRQGFIHPAANALLFYFSVLK